MYAVTITDKSNLIKHQGYVSEISRNDIGVIRIVDTIWHDPFLGIISIPIRAEVSTSLEGKMATIAGFGSYTDTLSSDQLRFVDIEIVPKYVCDVVYGRSKVFDTNLCVRGTGGKSSCRGDSGINKIPRRHLIRNYLQICF